MGLYSIIITALAGLIGIWSDYFTQEKNDLNFTIQRKKLTIKIISTFLIIGSFFVGFFQWVGANADRQQQQQAYGTLDSTFRVSLRNGTAINNFEHASTNILGKIHAIDRSLDTSARLQIGLLQNVNQKTIELTNPIPPEILISWAAKGKVDSDINKKLIITMQHRTGFNLGYGTFILDDTAIASLLRDVYYPGDPVSAEIIDMASPKVSLGFYEQQNVLDDPDLLYSEKLKNFTKELSVVPNIVLDRYHFQEETHFVLDTRSQNIEMFGTVRLKLVVNNGRIRTPDSLKNTHLAFDIEGLVGEPGALVNVSELALTVMISSKYQIQNTNLQYVKNKRRFALPFVRFTPLKHINDSDPN